MAMSQETMTASEYLRKKYGDFSSATMIGPPPAAVLPQTQIMGGDVLTVGDMKLLQNAIDLELIRMQNLRSVSAIVTIKIDQLQGLAENLSDVVGRVERGEVRAEDVTIFPVTARQFLKTFRTSENVPELFDPYGNSPASMAAVSMSPSVSAEAPTVASVAEPTAAVSGPNFMHMLFQNIQQLKWSLDANYRAEAAKQRQMSESLKEMEKRILGYSYTDTPMPEGYQTMFLERIRGLQREINDSPE